LLSFVFSVATSDDEYFNTLGAQSKTTFCLLLKTPNNIFDIASVNALKR
jgi:hypothetical protein